MYEDIRSELDAGGRVYIVCPFVENSRAEGLQDVKAAEAEFDRLVVCSSCPSPGCLTGLVLVW